MGVKQLSNPAGVSNLTFDLEVLTVEAVEEGTGAISVGQIVTLGKTSVTPPLTSLTCAKMLAATTLALRRRMFGIAINAIAKSGNGIIVVYGPFIGALAAGAISQGDPITNDGTTAGSCNVFTYSGTGAAADHGSIIGWALDASYTTNTLVDVFVAKS